MEDLYGIDNLSYRDLFELRKNLRKERDQISTEREELTRKSEELLKEYQYKMKVIGSINNRMEKYPPEVIKSEAFKPYFNYVESVKNKAWDKALQFNNSGTMEEQVELFHGLMDLFSDN